MFLPAFEEKRKREQLEYTKENRLELPDYSEQYEQYIKKQKEEKAPETVIHIPLY